MTEDEMTVMASIAIEMQKNEVNEVLDRIRTEIENYDNFIICANGQKGIHIDVALDIIDKYKVESESSE